MAQKNNVRQIISVLTVLSLSLGGCGDFGNENNKDSRRKGAVETKPAPVDPGTDKNHNLPVEFSNPNSGDLSERKIFANLALNVFSKMAENFTNQLPVFEGSVETYCQALKSGADAQIEETDVKRDWLRVMTAFHQMEGAAFGPLVNNGRFISDYVYSWPFLNTCGIDQSVIAYAGKETINPQTLMFNLRGLAAIEYLIFDNNLVSRCNVRANPAVKVWNGLDTTTKRIQRCEWAKQLIPDLKEKASTLKQEWSTAANSYAVKLVEGALYESDKEALNALTDGLSNIEKLKDLKLGRPLGKHKDCSSDICPNDVEHGYSGSALLSAESQLRGFKAVFFGSANPSELAYSIDDLLVKQGRGDVAQRMELAIDKALLSLREAQKLGDFKSQIEAMDLAKCKSTTVENRLEPICAVYSDVRDVAFILKTEVLVALSLRAPPTHQGDND